jgi:tRNA-dihydrouridine synthase B
MAGMTDTAFRRCGLVVTEMVSSEGIVRGIGRTLEYAEYTEEERPVAVQIFGGDPANMATAARIVENMGADIVDINMGCPVPKIARNSAGCSLMREPEHAAAIVAAMANAVSIPVTVKMRAGWDEAHVNAAYRGRSDWELIARVAESVRIPVFGSGDLVEPPEIVERLRQSPIAGALVGRGILRNPWLLAQAADLMAGRPAREIALEERGRFLLDYISLLLNDRVDEAAGFRHVVPGPAPSELPRLDRRDALPGLVSPTSRDVHYACGRERWVINKLRALSSWYTKGHDGGPRLRVAINQVESIGRLRGLICEFYGVCAF